MDDQPLIILGASARAAAHSAARSGYQPYAIDLFADADLRALGPVQQISRYPAEFLSALAAATQAPWIYTGSLENYPRLVARMAKLRPLIGNGPETLARVRNPQWLAKTLADSAVRYPETRSGNDSIPAAIGQESRGSWLRKPVRSGGGLGIEKLSLTPDSRLLPPDSRPLTPDSCPLTPDPRLPTPDRCVLQRFTPGESLSASFLAANGKVQWIGAAEQWIGPDWGAPSEFQYAGSLAPANITPAEQMMLLNLAQRLTDTAGLQGLFGLDLIRNDHGWWLIEVNPRYTASMELHEQFSGQPWRQTSSSASQDSQTRRSAATTGRALIAEHCAAFDFPPTGRQGSRRAARVGHFHAKLVVYATNGGTAGENLQTTLALLATQGIIAADIPVSASEIKATSPICTLLTSGPNCSPVRTTLLTAAAHVRGSLTSL